VRRQALYRNLSLYYPSEQTDIMPTRLGNVLKAAELYSWKRYRLDAVIIWSRLESGIPDAFSTTLQDAKTSLDLMTTLSAFILLFGLPLAVWTALKTTGVLPWWIPLTLTLLALSLRLFLPAGLAALAFILALILIFTVPHPALLIVQLQVLLSLLVGISLLFWISYQNAVQAALGYGEKIKSAIDLYRWQVLEGLHLELPKDFEEERKIWETVEGLLVRNYSPDSRYYHYVQKEKTEGKDDNSSPKTK
ncbi:MAG: hypothetical protein M3Z24_00900, partial [Chloroflexota bacterium]|nr:hypothetical protein [Chloroflexota bacterium]